MANEVEIPLNATDKGLEILDAQIKTRRPMAAFLNTPPAMHVDHLQQAEGTYTATNTFTIAGADAQWDPEPHTGPNTVPAPRPR